MLKNILPLNEILIFKLRINLREALQCQTVIILEGLRCLQCLVYLHKSIIVIHFYF